MIDRVGEGCGVLRAAKVYLPSQSRYYSKKALKFESRTSSTLHNNIDRQREKFSGSSFIFIGTRTLS